VPQQLEVSSIEIEQLGDNSWYSKVSARIQGRDLGPRSQEFRCANHILLFEAISDWFTGFLPPVEPASVKRKGKVHG
jgi:hypothetical protein